MTYEEFTPADEEETARQAALFALTAKTLDLQTLLEQSEPQRPWMTRAMAAYQRVPDRDQQVLGIDLAIEALLLQQEQDLDVALAYDTLNRSLVKLTWMARDAVDHVKGRGPVDALSALCGLDGPPDATVLTAYLRTQLLLAKAAQTGASERESEEEDDLLIDSNVEARLSVTARELCRDYAGLLGAGAITPALEQLQHEHDINAETLIALAAASPLVPADRARMVGQALYAGLKGEMVQALYMLVPQFDHMLREALRVTPMTVRQTSSMASVPIEDPRVNELLGEGLTLAFQGVLCDGGGAGLRHIVLGGQADEVTCASPQALYFWWLMLQLVVETGAIARVSQCDVAAALSMNAAAAGGEGGRD